MHLSAIERLPAELIQPIFQLSGCNAALPLASPHLGAKLSSQHLYHDVCDNYLAQRLPDRVHQKNCQTDIFAAKWMTWDFFKSWVLGHFEPIGCLCGRTEAEGCWDKQWPINWEDASQMPFSRAHLPVLAWINCRFPRKMFTGEWTQDKIEFLRFLLWITSMTVNWADEEMREIVQQSRKDAVLQENLEAVELFNHNRRLGKAPDLHAVRFAVIDAGCNRSIVYDTLDMAHKWAKKETWDSEELDEWCATRKQAGDPKGEWLHQKLEELRAVPGEGGTEKKGGSIDPGKGDYEAEGDNLVVHKLKWNEVSHIRLFVLKSIFWAPI